jgi:hypothetical protein
MFTGMGDGMRRIVFLSAVLLALGIPGPELHLASAQTEFGENATIQFRVTEQSFEIPEHLVAGWKIVEIENTLSGVVGFDLLKLPDGVDVAATLEEINAGGTPEWFWTTTFAGSALVSAGETARILIDLAPGVWIALERIDGPKAFVVYPSTASPVPVSEPDADVSISEREFKFGGVPEQIDAGASIWKVTNKGEAIHHMLIVHLPVAATREQVIALATLPDGSTSPEGLPPLGQLEVAGGVGLLSPGVRMWAEIDLEPGFYAVICGVPSENGAGPSHAELGMVDVFKVVG